MAAEGEGAPGAAAPGRERKKSRKTRDLRILVIKGGGALGDEVVKGISEYHIPHHNIAVIQAGQTVSLSASEGSSDMIEVDIDKTDSIRSMFESSEPFDHLVCCGGSIASVWRPLAKATRAHYEASFNSKALGQIDLVLQASKKLRDGGSITLTTGMLETVAARHGHGIAAVNGAVSAFVRVASVEMPRGIRLNAVSPGVSPKLIASYPGLFAGFQGTDTSQVCQAYLRCIFGPINGKIVEMVTGSHFRES